LVSFGVFDLLILGQMGIFEVGIFHRSVAWVFSLDLDDELDEDPAWISPDTPALSPYLAGSRRRTPALSPYTVYNIRKKKKWRRKEKICSFLVFFKKKTNPDFGDVGKD
jgi:hypothetical protein